MEKRIGFGRRLGAILIDVVFISGIGFILASLFHTSFENMVDWSKFSDEQLSQMEAIYGNFTDTMLTIGVGASLAGFVYNLSEGFLGYTLGKLMLGIQVGNQDGTPANINTLMIRFALKNINTIVGLFGMVTLISAFSSIASGLGVVVIIGCFFALGEKKLALHDMIAKTAVYRKNELADGSAAKDATFE